MFKNLSYVFVLAAMFANGAYGMDHYFGDRPEEAGQLLEQFSGKIKEARSTEKNNKVTESEFKKMFNSHYLSKSVALHGMPVNDAVTTEIKNLLEQQQLAQYTTEYTRISRSESTVGEETMEAAEAYYSVNAPVYENGWHKVPQEIINDKNGDEYINEQYKFHVSIRWNTDENGNRTTIRLISVW